ncbi:MAG: hypothetical protein KJN64_00120 [Ignavibacteria bacterium]|nr:hypothetical protein [Ignavibacteria bacterium]MBT8392384.1 hypothetical protein [Ignavibacteria bacterium]
MIKFIRDSIITILFLILTYSFSFSQEINDVKIGIVHSELTKQLLHKNDKNFLPILHWELFFLNKKLSYIVFDDNDLNDFDFNEIDVLILPSVEILSNEAIENLKEYLNEGKSIFVLGKLGTFDPQLRKRIPDVLEILINLKIKELPIVDNIAQQFSFLSSNIITQDLTADKNFLILNRLTPLFAEELTTQAKVIGTYDLKRNTVNPFTGAATIEKEDGKALWFGFQLSQISLSEQQKEIFNRFILNGINWLTGNPSAWVNPFPEFYDSATLFSVWVKNINKTIGGTIPHFKKEKVTLNFFISASAISKSFEQIYKLSSTGNVNLLFDAFNHINKDSSHIESIFEETSRVLNNSSRQKYFGVQFINTTESDLKSVNLIDYYDFIIGPHFEVSFLKNGSKINPLQRLIPNYLNVFDGIIKTDNENYSLELNHLYDQTQKNHKILTHIINEKFFLKSGDQLKEKIKLTVDVARQKNSLITTYPELINWIITKSEVETNAVDFKDDSKLIIRIKNKGRSIVEQIGINISVPSKFKSFDLVGHDYRLKFNGQKGLYNLLIPFLHSGQTLTLDIIYEK